METIIVAARMVSGKSSKKLVKNRLTIIRDNEDSTPAIGLLAPASALTTVRDKLPVTANAELIPALILATTSAIRSCLLFKLLRYCKAVAWAMESDSTKLIMAIMAAPGNRLITRSQFQCGKDNGGKPDGISPTV